MRGWPPARGRTARLACARGRTPAHVGRASILHRERNCDSLHILVISSVQPGEEYVNFAGSAFAARRVCRSEANAPQDQYMRRFGPTSAGSRYSRIGRLPYDLPARTPIARVTCARSPKASHALLRLNWYLGLPNAIPRRPATRLSQRTSRWDLWVGAPSMSSKKLRRSSVVTSIGSSET